MARENWNETKEVLEKLDDVAAIGAALNASIVFDKMSIFEALLQYRVSNLKAWTKSNPLAAKTGDFDAILYGALIQAIQHGNQSATQKLLDQGIHLDSKEYAGLFFWITQDVRGDTPFLRQLLPPFELVELLANRGMQMNVVDYILQRTPLMDAVCTKNEALVKMVLSSGADPNIGTNQYRPNENRPLGRSVIPGLLNKSIPTLLLEHGATINDSYIKIRYPNVKTKDDLIGMLKQNL